MAENANLTAAPLTEQITHLVNEGEVTLPPFPKIGQRIIEILRNPDQVDTKQLAELVSSDPATAAALLKMANSAVFGGLKEVSDIGQAITRLGIKRVSTLVATLVLKGNFTSVKPDRRKPLKILWDHSVATALSARRLTDINGGDQQEAYLAGLLHDVGKLLVLKAADHLASLDEPVDITETVEEELLDVMHVDLGYHLLKEWRLPDAIAEAVKCHHDEAALDDNPLVVRVQAADAITRRLGAHPKADPDYSLDEIPAIQKLDLGDLELACLLVDLEDELDKTRKLF